MHFVRHVNEYAAAVRDERFQCPFNYYINMNTSQVSGCLFTCDWRFPFDVRLLMLRATSQSIMSKSKDKMISWEFRRCHRRSKDQCVSYEWEK